MSIISQRCTHTAVSLFPEIWVLIFDFATHVPGLLEADDVYSSDMRGPKNGGCQRRLLRHSLVTKRYLVRVCRMWKVLASRFLYQSILVGRARTVHSLCTMLVNSRRDCCVEGDGGSLDPPLGWWTKRLDIDLRDCGHGDLTEELKDLARAIRCLPNLTIATFIIRNQFSLHSGEVMDALCTCGPTMQILTVSSLEPSRNELQRLLTVSPNLRVLHCQHTPFLDSWDPEFPMVPALNSLGFTTTDCGRYADFPNHFPNLREVVCRYSPDGRLAWTSFLRVHGGNLTKITIYLEYIFTQADADIISKFCPNLQTLSLSLHSWGLLRKGTILPHVHHLWLRFGCPPKSEEDNLAIFSTLVENTPPSVRVIRLTDVRNVDHLRLRHAWVLMGGIYCLSRKNCILEDNDGHVMV